MIDVLGYYRYCIESFFFQKQTFNTSQKHALDEVDTLSRRCILLKTGTGIPRGGGGGALVQPYGSASSLARAR